MQFLLQLATISGPVKSWCDTENAADMIGLEIKNASTFSLDFQS